MDGREPPDDPVDFLGWYRDGWNTLDLDHILDAYAAPCFVAKGGKLLHLRDHAAKARHFGDLLAGNRGQGPHRWDLSDVDWWVVGDVVHE